MKTLLLMIFGPNMTSEKFALNFHDFVKGLYMALAPVGALFMDAFVKWTTTAGAQFTMNWEMTWKASLSVFVFYVVKNYFTSPPK